MTRLLRSQLRAWGLLLGALATSGCGPATPAGGRDLAGVGGGEGPEGKLDISLITSEQAGLDVHVTPSGLGVRF